jgi:predicted amidohydrolase
MPACGRQALCVSWRKIMRTLRIGLCQINTTVGDVEGNTRKILHYIQKGKKMGAYAHAQNILGDEANSLHLLSHKQSDNDAISSLGCAVNAPGSRRSRMPWKGKK